MGNGLGRSCMEALEGRTLLAGTTWVPPAPLVRVAAPGQPPVEATAPDAPRAGGVHLNSTITWWTESPVIKPASRTAGKVRVLFVGNSFTLRNGGIPGVAAALAKAKKETSAPAFGQAAHGGWWLQDLYAEPKTKARIAEKVTGSTARTWDYVVIQPHVLEPVYGRQNLIDAGVALDASIRAAGARTVIFVPWGRPDQPGDQPAMADACAALKRRLDGDTANKAAGRTALLVPVYKAWDLVKRRRPDIQLHNVTPTMPNDAHPSKEGTYLSAAVFYSFFYRHSAEGLWRPMTVTAIDKTRNYTIPKATASYLSRIAFKVAKEAGFAPA